MIKNFEPIIIMKSLNIFFIAVLLTMSSFVHCVPVKRLVSHVAVYKVSLLKQTSLYSEASGKMKLRFQETKDAWISQQSTDVFLYTHFGTESRMKAVLSTWEAKDSNSFRFMLNISDGKGSAKISGSAERDAKTGMINVHYKLPVERKVVLDKDVLFPVQHMARLLGAAKEKQVVDDSKVFDGTNEQNDIMDINTIIGNSAMPKEETAKFITIKAEPSFPIVMSVYLNPENQSPDYRITQRILETGIVEGMILDFVKSNYQLKAELTNLELL